VKTLNRIIAGAFNRLLFRKDVVGLASPTDTMAKVAKKKAVETRSPYRATSVVCADNACQAAKRINGKRFLDVDRSVPKLPLPECDAAHCGCKYEHHDDRRHSDEDRRHPNALKSQLHAHSGSDEKRASKRGRRKSDIS